MRNHITSRFEDRRCGWRGSRSGRSPAGNRPGRAPYRGGRGRSAKAGAAPMAAGAGAEPTSRGQVWNVARRNMADTAAEARSASRAGTQRQAMPHSQTASSSSAAPPLVTAAPDGGEQRPFSKSPALGASVCRGPASDLSPSAGGKRVLCASLPTAAGQTARRPPLTARNVVTLNGGGCGTADGGRARRRNTRDERRERAERRGETRAV